MHIRPGYVSGGNSRNAVHAASVADEQHSLVHCSVDERGKHTDVGKDELM